MSLLRDEKGRFIKGHSGNPKGKSREEKIKELEFIKAVKENVPLEEWKAVIEKALEQAKVGDGKARQFLADYLMGPAKQSLELSGGLDIFELDWSDWENEDDSFNEGDDIETSPEPEENLQ